MIGHFAPGTGGRPRPAPLHHALPDGSRRGRIHAGRLRETDSGQPNVVCIG